MVILNTMDSLHQPNSCAIVRLKHGHPREYSFFLFTGEKYIYIIIIIIIIFLLSAPF